MVVLPFFWLPAFAMERGRAPAGSQMGGAGRGAALIVGGAGRGVGLAAAVTSVAVRCRRLAWRYSVISTVTDCGLPVALPVSASAALTVMVASPACASAASTHSTVLPGLTMPDW